MKKWKCFQKIVCVALTLAMIMGLSACGSKEEVVDDATLSKEYVYSYEEVNVTDLGDEMSVASMTEYNDRIYIVLDIYHYDVSVEEQYEAKLLSMNPDGTDVKETVLELPVVESRIDPDAENAEDLYENTSYSTYALGKKGILYAVKDYYFEDYSDMENPVVEQKYYICAWDLNGKYLWETPIELAQTADSYNYVSKMLPAEDGSMTALVSGDSTYKFEIDAEGNVSQKQSLKSVAAILEQANDFIIKEDGTLLITYYSDDGNTLYLNSYDVEADKLGTAVKLPDAMVANGYNCINAGIGKDIVYSAMDGVYGFNLGDEESVQIMDFVNSDLNTSAMDQIIYLDETHFIGFYMDNTEYENNCAIFTKVNPEDIQDKTVIVMAGNYIDYEVMNRIVEFNRQSDKYRIVTKEYDSYNTVDDYTVGMTQLNNDIISGNMPDILVVDDTIPLETYISKGLIADIGALIDGDAELSRDDYLDNVFNALSVDGKLYQVVPYFYVSTMMGKTSVLGEIDGWNMQEFTAFEESLPEGSKSFGELTREDFLYSMLHYCGTDLVDFSTGKCNFDSQEFINLLEYAKTLPVDYSAEAIADYQSQYRDNRTALMEVCFGSVQEMSIYMNGYFGEDVTFIGFPSESKDGSVLLTDVSYALSAKSENLEGAWEFIRYYLTAEFQETLQWEFPVLESVFMQKAQEALERPYYFDENGEKAFYDNYMTINGESMLVELLNQNQIDQVVDMVLSTEKQSYYDVDIENIIAEEAAAFFENQKSAEEVAQIIQNRAQTYVDENR